MDSPTDEPHRSHWRIAAWATAALLLLVPLVAMQFTDGVDWTGSDFVFAAVLLFGSLGAYEFVSRVSSHSAYRTAAGLGLGALVLLLWSNGAVGLTDSPADALFFLLVPAVSIVGALVARFRARGMAVAMFMTALTQGLIGVIALVAGLVPAYNSALEVLGITGFFVVLFVGSALLFQKAAREEAERDEA